MSNVEKLKDVEFRSLRNRIDNCKFKEVALAILEGYREKLSEDDYSKLKEEAEGKKEFGYWVSNEDEYERELNLALDLARIKVIKGNTCNDREDYRVAKRIAKEYPSLVGLNTFDYFRQYCLFFSDHAKAIREFGLVELAKQNNLLGKIKLS